MRVELHPKQSVAFQSKATEILYGGAAGGGKSHLMRVCALAWCVDIPGLQVYLFRRTYPDLWKNHMEGPSGFPAMVSEWVAGGFVKLNLSDGQVIFSNGSKIHLCHCQNDKDVFKYQGAEIHCVEENERLRMADGSLKGVSEIKAGDYVSTLQGARMVTWVGDRERKPCVTAKVVSRGVVVQQVHSQAHKVLTPIGWVSYDDIANESRLSSTCEPIQTHSSRKCVEPFASESRSVSPSHESPYQDSEHKAEFAQLFRGNQSGLETSAYAEQQAQEIDFESSSCDSQESDKPSLGFSFPVVLHAPSHNQEEAAFPNASQLDAVPCALIEYKGKGCRYGYQPCFGSCGECRCEALDKTHDASHIESDVLQHNPMRLPLDGLGIVQKHIPSGPLRYGHPYTGEERISVEEYQLGTCELTPCGEKWTIDLMVEGENHYITESGLVNKNCLLMDELTHFSEPIYRFLRGRCRLGAFKLPEQWKGLFPRIIAGANPGGIGHHWVKSSFIDGSVPLDVRRMDKKEGGMLRQYIPAKLSDNPTMDEDYADKLSGLGNESLVRAMLDGDWEIISGAYFTEFSRTKHVIKPFSIPVHWNRYRCFDWGSAKPFACYWIAVADGTTNHPRGALIVYREYYGMGDAPNKGLKLPADRVAQEIFRRDQGETVNSVCNSVADPAIFTADGGPSIADTMRKEGVKWRHADNKRKAGWEQLRIRLNGDDDGKPLIYVFETCVHLIRTLPALQHDENDPEDVDSDQEDHGPDALRYGCMARPIIRDGVKARKGPKPGTFAHLLEITDEPKTASKYRSLR